MDPKVLIVKTMISEKFTSIIYITIQLGKQFFLLKFLKKIINNWVQQYRERSRIISTAGTAVAGTAKALALL